MNTVTDIRNIAVNVTDQDTALALYKNTLGFATHMHAQTPAARWIIITLPNTNATEADTGIRFGATDAALSHQTLTDQVVTVSELLIWEGVPPMFSFDDPDHNRFYIIEDQS